MSLRDLAGLRHDRKLYLSRRLQLREELEKMLELDLRDFSGHTDSAWDAMPPGTG